MLPRVRVQRLESQLPVVDVFVVLLHRGAQLVVDSHGVGLVARAVRLDDSVQRSETVVGPRAFGALVALKDLESLVLLARGRRRWHADEQVAELARVLVVEVWSESSMSLLMVLLL